VSIALEAKRGETEISSLAHLDDELEAEAAAQQDESEDQSGDDAGDEAEQPRKGDRR
jgi:hypothetical protein